MKTLMIKMLNFLFNANDWDETSVGFWAHAQERFQ